MNTLQSETVTDPTGKHHKVELIQTVTVDGYDVETVICKAYIDGHMYDWTSERSERIYRSAKLAANGEIHSYIPTLAHLQ